MNDNIEIGSMDKAEPADLNAGSDARVTADTLIVVDVQKAFIDGDDPVPDHEKLMPAVQTLLNNAREQQALVVFLQNDGRPGTSDEPETPGWELAFQALSGEKVVRKRHDNGFEETRLESLLDDHGSRVVAVCGVMSEMCVAATARGAMARNYQVVLAHDAHATYDVPAGPGSEPVPARLASRAAEWSLGDEIVIVGSGDLVRFVARPPAI